MFGFGSRFPILSALIGGTVVVAGCGSDGADVAYWTNSTDQNKAVESYVGAEHCGWQDVTFLHVQWPLPGQTGAPANRQYIKDPTGRLRAETQGTYAPIAQLPADARTTDYTGPDGQQLWFAPSNSDNVAYVVYPDSKQLEAWPRTTRSLGCD